MRLFLFGGAKKGEVERLLKFIEDIFNSLDIKEILHIPFARTGLSDSAWAGDWFQRNIKLNKAQYFNAKNKQDILRVKNPLIFISGGNKDTRLLEKIKENDLLLNLVKNAKYIVAESSGAKILAESVRVKDVQGNPKLVKGLGIVKNTVIEPHYFEKNRENLLESEMKETDFRYGLGIDSMSGIEFKLEEFPNKYQKLGDGLIKIKKF